MLHENANANSLGMVRIWVFGLAAMSRLLTPVWEVCLLPDVQPVGIMRWLGTRNWAPLITMEMAYAIQAITIGLLLFAAAGIGPYSVIAPLACLALILSEGLIRVEGILPHANIILIFCTCILACFPAADGITLFRKKPPNRTSPGIYRAALVTLTLVFSITYLLAAARRFSSSGIGIYFDDSILYATAWRDAERGSEGGLGIWMCESWLGGWSLRLGFPVVTMLEFLTPLCLFSKWFRWCWIAVMVPFHIGAGVLMGIWFTYNLALIPVLIAGFDPFRNRTQQITSATRTHILKCAA